MAAMREDPTGETRRFAREGARAPYNLAGLHGEGRAPTSEGRALTLALRLLGLFYLGGGLAATLMLARGRWIEAATEALEGGVETRHRLRYALLAAVGALTATSGLALLALHRSAPALMAATLAAQGLWLAYAGRAFPPQDEDDATGRARTFRAAVLYAAATAFVVWAVGDGGVALAPHTGVAVALAALLAGALAYAAWSWRAVAPREPADDVPWPDDDDDGGEQETQNDPRNEAGRILDHDAPGPRPADGPRRLLLAPRAGGTALRDGDDGAPWEPEELGLPGDVIDRIRCLEMDVIEAAEETPDGPRLSPEALSRLAPEAQAIAQALAELYGPGNVEWRLPPARA